jgi:hypothetical protein
MKFSLGFITAALRASLDSVPCATGVQVNATGLTQNAKIMWSCMSGGHGLSLTAK